MLAVWYERQGADRGVAGRRDAGSRARPRRTQTWRGPAILAKFALHCLTRRPHLVPGLDPAIASETRTGCRDRAK
jgi:hypothetical protein